MALGGSTLRVDAVRSEHGIARQSHMLTTALVGVAGRLRSSRTGELVQGLCSASGSAVERAGRWRADGDGHHAAVAV